MEMQENMNATTTGNWADRAAMAVEVFLNAVIGCMMLVMCAVTAWQIFSRYVLHDMSSWSEEVARFMMVWISLLGSAAVMRSGGHVTVTVLVDRLSPVARRWVMVVRDLIMAVTLIVLAWYGWEFADMNAVQLSAAMDIPMSWVYASLWLGAALIFALLLLIRLSRHTDWTGRQDEQP